MASLILCLACLPARGETPSDLHIYPYLQNVTTEAISILWETPQATRGTVEYGEGEKLEFRVTENEKTSLHRIRLTDLQPATTYRYQVHLGSRSLPPATFRTLPRPDEDEWRIVFYGDNRSNPRVHKRIVEEIRKAKPLLVVNTGDLVADGNKYEEWKNQYFDPLRGLAENVPVFTCLGNHEKNAPLYYDYMELPGDQGEVFYALPVGNAVLIGLNSNASDADYRADSAQTRWLVDTLERYEDKRWKIVFFHHPLFRSHPTRGITAQRWIWQPIFDQYGVDLVITGHDHHYMRSHPIGRYLGAARPGVRHIITGGGGAGLYSVQPRPYVAAQKKTHHMVVLESRGEKLRGWAVDLNGQIIDIFSFAHDDRTPPKQLVSYEMFALEQALRMEIGDAPFLVPTAAPTSEKRTLEVENPFQEPLLLEVKWVEMGAWATPQNNETIHIVPGNPIVIPIEVQGHSDKLYPIPKLQLRFTDPDGKEPFLNHTTVIYPLKVRPERTLSINRARRAPRIDGRIREKIWKKSPRWSSFVDVQNDRLSPHKITVKAAHRSDVLYVAATIHTPPPPPRNPIPKRDALLLTKTEHFRVHLAIGDKAFTYLVNVDGVQLDAARRKRTWNATGFRSAVVRHDDRWTVELAIPLEIQSERGQPLRLNVAYRHGASQSESELIPSFGMARRESRVPAFTGEWSNPLHFAPLRLR